ncbi:MAG TPA: DNA recombination protein RmuC [Desulfotomaculum sp.]|nr:DNA recombination protein RmuC [Desulfotomaculum sp.]
MPDIIVLGLLFLLILGVIVLQIILRSKLQELNPLIRYVNDNFVNLNSSFQQLNFGLNVLGKTQEKIEHSLREEIGKNREEITGSLNLFGGSISARIAEMANLQQNQLDGVLKQINALTQSNEQKLEAVRSTVEGNLRYLQENNTKKLEEMRATVDEKLHHTLEQRLGESFKLVSERLEQVYKGLGEMQTLAVGVGDLKKVLTNVKARGIFGEIQLGNILEEILTPEQYLKNVPTKKNSSEIVEYAVKLPGPDDAGPVLLPIDAKFSQEDYLRLLDAYETGKVELIEQAGKGLESRIKSQAKDICAKYISVPETTDFGIMFLPTESLYAEVLRRTGLVEHLQREYKVNVTGPSTLAAFLNSLAVGFKTLAIQKHSSEVWTLLGSVKTEFNKYSSVLDKIDKQLKTVTNTVTEAQRRTRVIQKSLKNVEETPGEKLLMSADLIEIENGEDEVNHLA